MAHLVETMAYAGQTPWHGLGVEVPENITVERMLKVSGLDWEVKKQPLFTKESGAPNSSTIPVPGFHSLVRSTDDKVLGICGDRFQPTQNKDAFGFFDKFVDSGKMQMHTAGSLDEGRWTWGLAKVAKHFTVGRSDEVETFLLFSNPHIWGESIKIMFTPIRVVCNNTLTVALRQKTEERMFRMMHSKAFSGADLYVEAERVLGILDTQLEEYKEAANLLAGKDIKKESSLFKYMLSVLTPQHPHNDNIKYEDLPLRVKNVLELVDSQPGAKLKSSKDTWWGAYNAITFGVDHVFGRSRDTALTSAWFGSNAQLKRRALTLAVDMAKKAA